MRGSIVNRYKGSWSIILDAYETDPNTGKAKRKRKWYTVKGNKKDAQRRLTELLHQADTGTLIDPSKMTVGEWLHQWLETVVKPRKRPRTYDTYQRAVANHLIPALGHFRVQQLQPQHIQAYYAASGLSEATLGQHHAIISGALKAAAMQGQVSRNVATLVIAKPCQAEEHPDVREKCWTAAEVQKFLAVAHTAGEQMACLYHLALDSGARKSELCGLQWAEVDLGKGQIQIVRQLLKPTAPPPFGPPKNGSPRVISLMPQTVELLRRHKVRQAATKLANRHIYNDFDLVFARDWNNRGALGYALPPTTVGGKAFKTLIAQAGIKTIVFHGLRHTSGTLLLQAGVLPHVVQRRLGHKNIKITMDTYAHVLPEMRQDAAEKLASVIHPTKSAVS